VRVSARSDYATRACIELAVAEGRLVKSEAIARAQEVPQKFLEGILNDLRRGQIVTSQRGNEGGYRLARPAEQISVADIIRVVDGPLVSVREARPPDLAYAGAAQPLLLVWVALRASVRDVLEAVTLADLAAGRLPASVVRLTEAPAAWANP
jgi:Rrf2 family protein